MKTYFVVSLEHFEAPCCGINPWSANHNNCCLLCLLLNTLKVIVANSVDPDQTAPLGAVWSGSKLFFDLGFTALSRICLYAKSMFEKFARRCSRRHKQTTFSDAGFLGALRVKKHWWGAFNERPQLTLQPLYNTVCYNTVLDKTWFKDGSKKCIDYIEK